VPPDAGRGYGLGSAPRSNRLLEAERSLDHKIGNQVQRAYLRTDFFDQRRELAELWGANLMGEFSKQ